MMARCSEEEMKTSRLRDHTFPFAHQHDIVANKKCSKKDQKEDFPSADSRLSDRRPKLPIGSLIFIL